MATKMITLTARASLNEVFSACGELVLICIDFMASCRQTPGDSLLEELLSVRTVPSGYVFIKALQPALPSQAQFSDC